MNPPSTALFQRRANHLGQRLAAVRQVPQPGRPAFPGQQITHDLAGEPVIPQFVRCDVLCLGQRADGGRRPVSA